MSETTHTARIEYNDTIVEFTSATPESAVSGCVVLFREMHGHAASEGDALMEWFHENTEPFLDDSQEDCPNCGKPMNWDGGAWVCEDCKNAKLGR